VIRRIRWRIPERQLDALAAELSLVDGVPAKQLRVAWDVSSGV